MTGSSSAQAALWRGLADRVHYVGDLEAGVAELRAGHVGLVVLVNKYDGIDLPGTACEMLVIDGIPRPMSAADRREAAALIDSPTRRARDAQRIEQGMGRGVRDVQDHCAVLLLSAGLAIAVHDNAWLDQFSPATRAQLVLSRDVAIQLYGQGVDGVRSALSVCLDRHPEWVQRSRLALASVRYRNVGAVRPEAIAAREAFDLAVAGQTSQLPTGCKTRSTASPTPRCAAGSASRRPATCTSPIPTSRSSSSAPRSERTRWCCARDPGRRRPFLPHYGWQACVRWPKDPRH
ncbi:hypothetical protein [Amycolatopsis sp. NPDC051061]|uniref:hypothetical protein n=1 Tax=Amycolatopsis sp. NPDC051061 TaxID=3155042 RepID=UPI003439F25D